MTTRKTFPLSLDIRPANQADTARLPELLCNCRPLDIDFDFTIDHSSGSASIYGVSEADLETIVEQLISDLPTRPHIDAPKVNYREVLTRERNVAYNHKRTRNGVEEFASVHLSLSVVDPDLPLSFVLAHPVKFISPEILEAIKKGVASAQEAGPIAGEPIYGAQVTLVSLNAKEGASAPFHFEIAARAATREALRTNCQMHEPIMALEVSAPAVNTRAVVVDLMSRRGTVLRQRANDLHSIVEAEVPLSKMFAYINSLRSMTKGVGTYTQRFSHYAPVPTASGPDDPDDFAPALALRP